MVMVWLKFCQPSKYPSIMSLTIRNSIIEVFWDMHWDMQTTACPIERIDATTVKKDKGCSEAQCHLKIEHPIEVRAYICAHQAVNSWLRFLCDLIFVEQSWNVWQDLWAVRIWVMEAKVSDEHVDDMLIGYLLVIIYIWFWCFCLGQVIACHNDITLLFPTATSAQLAVTKCHIFWQMSMMDCDFSKNRTLSIHCCREKQK